MIPKCTTGSIPELTYPILNADPLLSDRESALLLDCGRSTVWRWAAEGVIPRPLKIGGMSRWRKSDIEAVIAKADAQRNAA